MMTLDYYQELAATTNQYPANRMLECLVLGLCSEAGELAGKVKKFHRGDMETVPREALMNEAGDCLWYISQICKELGYSLDQMATNNLYKLRDRAERNQIKGSGDNR